MIKLDSYHKQLRLFGKLSVAEGCSFLILLLIAMPFKYLLDSPLLVKYFGWLHGVLFVAYVFQLLYITYEFKWSFKRLFLYFIAAFLPLAPFMVDKQIKKEMNEEIETSI